MQANRTATAQGVLRLASSTQGTKGMYGLEATHPQHLQIVRMPGRVAAKSLGTRTRTVKPY